LNFASHPDLEPDVGIFEEKNLIVE